MSVKSQAEYDKKNFKIVKKEDFDKKKKGVGKGKEIKKK